MPTRRPASRAALLATGASLALVLGAGCLWPTPVSPDCKKAMSECMSACPDPKTDSAERDALEGDTRSTCERRCHDACK